MIPTTPLDNTRTVQALTKPTKNQNQSQNQNQPSQENDTALTDDVADCTRTLHKAVNASSTLLLYRVKSVKSRERYPSPPAASALGKPTHS